ncbi:MAG: Rrf2 family transcriptional regulator [Chloroflexota bacterium]
MSNNSNFTIAVHTLTLIARHGQPLSSSFIADSVTTSPVTIRKLVRVLREGGLVRTLPGSAGGTVLSRPASDISLKDIYELFRNETLFGLYPSNPNPQCIVGRHLEGILVNVFADAESLLASFLAKTTLADILETVVERDEKLT